MKGDDIYMPLLDGTGPMGAGSRTGRGMGPCGHGRRNRVCCPCFSQGMRVSDKDKVEYLKDEAERLEEELKTIKSELEKSEK